MPTTAVLVVRETPSLADSVQLLLETVGFEVVPVDSVPPALARLQPNHHEPIRAIVVACNQPHCETLRRYPHDFPPDSRDLPLLVVGARAAESHRTWPSNVRFVGLPFEASGFVTLLNEVTAPREPRGVEPALADS